jgi:hypothetical protein
LLLGPKRFTDLRAGLPGASPNALADRLNELAVSGVIRRRQLAAPAASWVYELTEWGQRLEPIVLALGTWALSASAKAEQTFVSLDSLMLTIRTYYSPAPGAPTDPVSVAVRIAGNDGMSDFGIWLDASSARVSHEPPDQPDAIIIATVPTMLEALGDPGRLDSRSRQRLKITGDTDVVRRLLAGVTVPQPEVAEDSP